ALKHGELGHAIDDLRYELEGARPGADHRHALAREVHVVIPARGVKGRPAKAIQPGDGGDGRAVQRAGAEHQVARADHAAVSALDGPAVVDVLRALDASAETKTRPQPVALHGAPDV